MSLVSLEEYKQFGGPFAPENPNHVHVMRLHFLLIRFAQSNPEETRQIINDERWRAWIVGGTVDPGRNLEFEKDMDIVFVHEAIRSEEGYTLAHLHGIFNSGRSEEGLVHAIYFDPKPGEEVSLDHPPEREGLNTEYYIDITNFIKAVFSSKLK